MPAIKLNDRFGLDIDVQPAPFSALVKYATALPTLLMVEGANLARAAGMTLADPAVTSLTTGLAFNQPVGLGQGAPALTVEAGVHGSFAVVSRSPGNEKLLRPDVFGANVEIPAGTCYTATALEASAGASLSGSAGVFGFGIEPGASLTLTNYRPFPAEAAAPTLLEAVSQSVGGFVIPGDTADLAAVPERGVVTAVARGTLKLSGTANLLALANPLATVELPAGAPKIAVKAGGAVKVGASFQVSGEHHLRVQNTGGGRVLVGWYRRHASEFKVKATASEGLAASIGDTDLFAKIVGAVSSDAAADTQELSRAGLSGDRAAAIQGAVKAAIERKLELALSFEIGAATSDDAAFLYEVELDALDDTGRAAVDAALAGDLTSLEGDTLPAGIRLVRSAFHNLRQRNHTLKINLLGIYNAISISRLALSGSTLFDPVTGSLVMTDTATADRIRASAVNFGADTDKLRHVLAECFLITAIYRGSRLSVSAPSLKASHSFYDTHARTNRETMRDYLQIGLALGLVAKDAAVPPAETDDFGRTAVFAETQYDEALATALFLNPDGSPRPVEEYERAGRAALQLTVRADSSSAFRLRPAIDDTLWAEMKDKGQANFRFLFPPEQAPVIAGDFTAITWWAEAMHNAGRCLADIGALLALNPEIRSDDPRFEKLREKLAGRLAGVAGKTREEFGLPWGLVAMDYVSGRQAGAGFAITGPRLTLAGGREKAIAAG